MAKGKKNGAVRKEVPEIRTSADLRAATLRQIQGLEEGTVTPQHAVAFSKLVAQVQGMVRLELDMARFVADSRAATNGAHREVVAETKPIMLR